MLPLLGVTARFETEAELRSSSLTHLRTLVHISPHITQKTKGMLHSLESKGGLKNTKSVLNLSLCNK